MQAHIDDCGACFGIVRDMALDDGVTETISRQFDAEPDNAIALGDTLASDEHETAPSMIADTQTVSQPDTQPSAPRSSTELCEPGTIFDHFRVIRLIGRGGMGEVYLGNLVDFL